MHTVSQIISDETLSRIVDIESAGNPKAKARTSSATGLGQFINSTWLTTVEHHRPDLWEGRTKVQVLALRTDPALSIELLARLTEDSAKALGAGWTDGDLYLAHFSGIQTARRLRATNPATRASEVFSREQIAANRSILEGKTVGQVRAWAARKMAGAKTHWVAHFMVPTAAPAPEPEPAPEPGPAASDPTPAPREPEPAIEDTPAPVPPAPTSLWKRIRNWAGGIGGTSGVGFLAYLTDWKVIATIGGLVLVTAILIVIFMGPGRVREFIAKQVRRCFP